MSESRLLDQNKICFVACVNDEAQFENFCMAGLRRLVVPDGMSVEVLTVDDAPSMTAGYEKARISSDAKYKVYLHQDKQFAEYSIHQWYIYLVYLLLHIPYSQETAQSRQYRL